NAILAMLSNLLAICGIYTLNDIYDLQEDRINAPYRPLPSGLVTLREAYALVVVYFAWSLALSVLVGPVTFFLDILLCSLGIAYSVPPIRLKRMIFSYSIVGSGFFLSTLMGSTVAIPTFKALYLASIIFLMVTGLLPIKDFETMEGDKAAGIRTLPLRIGRRRTAKIMAPTSFIVVGMVIIAPSIFMFNYLFFLLVPFCAFLILFGTFYLLKKPEGDISIPFHILQAGAFLLPLGFTVGSIAL
ncbi:UbiA family prenyltransferase, partial [Candidatus Bathyarchaeota archaeon]|nr:UbiA family prenyltransferase [Candidatus Bathyarchaeota archaeon]